MTRQSVQLQRELEEAYEHQRQLREEHRKIIHQVAVSPVKKTHKDSVAKRPTQAPPPVKNMEEDKAPAVNVVAEATAAAPAEGIIPAYRPVSQQEHQKHEDNDSSLEESQDTFGRIVDASVARNMEMAMESQHQREHTIIMESPAFLTSKRKAMHCEMDEPGFDIPYPKNNQKKGILRRLLSCFHTPSVYSPPRVTSPRPRPSSAGMIPPTLTLESQVAPLRASLNMSDATAKKKTMDVVVREDPMYEALAPVYEVKREEEQEALTLPLVRQESFESLVAEVSDAENTPVMASKIPRCPVAQEHEEVKKTALAVSDLVTTQRPSRQYHVIHHARRPSEINSAPCSPEKTAKTHHGPVSAPSSRASSPTKSFVSNTKTRTAASPLKAPSHPPRMTKAALARNEATRKKIEQQKRKEQAHMNAMPVEIRRQSHPKKHVAQSVTDSDAILSMMSPEALESKEQISHQSIDAFLPKLKESLESLQHNWDSSKIADVQSAAIQVHKSFSDQNHVQSMSFSEDPFYRELAKIDRSLTPQDLDLLRAALLKSEDLNHHLS